MTYERIVTDRVDHDGNRYREIHIGKSDTGTNTISAEQHAAEVKAKREADMAAAARLVPRPQPAYSLPAGLDPRIALQGAITRRDVLKAVRDTAAATLDRCRSAHELAAANVAKLSGVHGENMAHIVAAFKARPADALPDELPDDLQARFEQSEAAKKERDKLALVMPELQKELEAADAALGRSHADVDGARLAVAYAEAIPAAQFIMELKTELWRLEDILNGMGEISMQLPIDTPRPPKPAILQEALNFKRDPLTATPGQPSGVQATKAKWREHFAELSKDHAAEIKF